MGHCGIQIPIAKYGSKFRQHVKQAGIDGDRLNKGCLKCLDNISDNQWVVRQAYVDKGILIILADEIDEEFCGKMEVKVVYSTITKVNDGDAIMYLEPTHEEMRTLFEAAMPNILNYMRKEYTGKDYYFTHCVNSMCVVGKDGIAQRIHSNIELTM